MMDHLLYILRWVVLAIPGALLVDYVGGKFFKAGMAYRPSLYLSMVLTQAFLGAIVYYIDRLILL
jgi:hypothetical protein